MTVDEGKFAEQYIMEKYLKTQAKKLKNLINAILKKKHKLYIMQYGICSEGRRGADPKC